MFRKASYVSLAMLLVLSLLVSAGCSDDDPGPDSTGTIEIELDPNGLDAPWTLSGANNYTTTGDGNQTLNGMDLGEYTLVWGEVVDYITPANDTQTLVADDLVTFVGAYVPEVGTIEINQTPDVLDGAGWTLTGPQDKTGSGDLILTDMPVGEYTVTWDAVGGYITPSIDTQALAADGTITFDGTYVEDPDLTGDFVQIPSGMFEMGSPTDELGRDSDETQHTVTLTHSFKVFSTEVTNQQYADLAQWAYDQDPPLISATSSTVQDALDGSTQELLNLHGAYSEISFSGGAFTVDVGKEDHPVNEVTWYGAVAYCDWLSQQADLPRAYDHSTWECNGNDPYSAQGYRLPTEAEWEYACRAGSGTAFANGEITSPYCNDPVLDEIGWYCGNANRWVHPVGQLIANSFGLYDMHGNLMEWCNDWWGSYSGDETNPVGGPPAFNRVIRDGRWNDYARYCRSANRCNCGPNGSSRDIGFRPLRSTN